MGNSIVLLYLLQHIKLFSLQSKNQEAEVESNELHLLALL